MSKHEWIPVSERLPDEDGFYWCYTECPPQSHPQQALRFKGGKWWSGWAVTHWMPLPPQPDQAPPSSENEITDAERYRWLKEQQPSTTQPVLRSQMSELVNFLITEAYRQPASTTAEEPPK